MAIASTELEASDAQPVHRSCWLLGLCRHNLGRRVRCVDLAFDHALLKYVDRRFEPHAGKMGFASARDLLHRDASSGLK